MPTKKTAKKRPGRYLQVGITTDGKEVIINHPRLDVDRDGRGYITFTPEQARHLGRLLIEKAQDIEPADLTIVCNKPLRKRKNHPVLTQKGS